ncbi:PDZ domain-containing protein [Halosquirtibacter laminarini]|uniref:PDZ domain-containing protein n=1 Tax=Halosquirtibacter laminarini TaxID=3374600 RepID=A0AC61NQ39_9BACT|nr:PDZ domain-containing protein [Prolixibacteraceae bacterium]
MALQNWTCQDEHSLVGDAQFMDAANGDFTVKSSSPAIRLGFMNFKTKGMGVTIDRLKDLAPEPKINLPLHYFNNVREGNKRVEFQGVVMNGLDNESEQTAYGSKELSGVILEAIHGYSHWKAQGFKVDDVILAIDDVQIKDIKTLVRLLKGAKEGQKYKATVLCAQDEMVVEFKL